MASSSSRLIGAAITICCAQRASAAATCEPLVVAHAPRFAQPQPSDSLSAPGHYSLTLEGQGFSDSADDNQLLIKGEPVGHAVPLAHGWLCFDVPANQVTAPYEGDATVLVKRPQCEARPFDSWTLSGLVLTNRDVSLSRRLRWGSIPVISIIVLVIVWMLWRRRARPRKTPNFCVMQLICWGILSGSLVAILSGLRWSLTSSAPSLVVPPNVSAVMLIALVTALIGWSFDGKGQTWSGFHGFMRGGILASLGIGCVWLLVVLGSCSDAGIERPIEIPLTFVAGLGAVSALYLVSLLPRDLPFAVESIEVSLPDKHGKRVLILRVRGKHEKPTVEKEIAKMFDDSHVIDDIVHHGEDYGPHTTWILLSKAARRAPQRNEQGEGNGARDVS